MMIPDKKRILKQFQWFQVQTKVRQLMIQILQPLQQKILSNTKSISKLSQQTSLQKYKTQQITLMIYNNENIFQTGIFSNIQQKFDNQSIHIKQLQNKIIHLQQFINEKAHVLDKRLEQSTEVLTGINIFKDDIKQQMQNQAKIIIDSQSNIFNSFADINQQIGEFQVKVSEFQSNISLNNFKIQKTQDEFHKINTTVDKNLKYFNQILKQTTQQSNLNHNTITILQSQIKRIDKFQIINRKQQATLNQCITKIDDLQYKIQVLQPLISFTQINQYAHKILPQKYHKNISIYYYNKYNQLIQEIVNNNYQHDRMKESVRSNMENIKNAHKKAIKMIFKIKKEMLMEKGIDINLVTHEKKEEYLQSIKLEADLNLDEGEENKNKKILAEEEEMNKMKDKILHQVDSIQGRIILEIRDSKKYIQSVQQLLNKNIINIQSKVDKVQNLIQKDKVQTQLHFKDILFALMQINKQLQLQKQITKSNKSSIKKIQNILNMLTQLQKQDEKDRLSISLLGIKQTHRDQIKTAQQKIRKKSVVDVNQGCLSCSGNPNYYNQFFKMACLNYNSSPIRYNKKQYERIEMLNLVENQLKNIGQNVEEKTQKITKSKQFESSRYQKSSVSNEVLNIASKTSNKKAQNIQTTIRNIASSHQMKPINNSQQARLISPSELSPDILNRTRNRFYSRKVQNTSFRDSLNKKQLSNKKHQEKNSYMMHVSHFFRELKKNNELMIKME